MRTAKSSPSVLAGLALLTTLTATPVSAQLSCPDGFERSVLTVSTDVQTVQLPDTATTLIARAIGAGGGNSGIRSGGRGALVEGRFNVSGGAMLQVIVGDTGSNGGGTGIMGGGGGGASLVALGPTLASAQVLLIAGGGGGAGAGETANGGDGGIPGPAGSTSDDQGATGGSAGGNGGAGDFDPMNSGEDGAPGGSPQNGGGGTFCAGGGAGQNQDGGSNTTEFFPPVALQAGAEGGLNLLNTSGFGGIGGGGAPGNCGGGGGGLGGGGAGGAGDMGDATNGGGGGGGSLNTGSAALNMAGFNPAATPGLVELCYDFAGGDSEPRAVPALSPWSLIVLVLMMFAGALVLRPRQS